MMLFNVITAPDVQNNEYPAILKFDTRLEAFTAYDEVCVKYNFTSIFQSNTFLAFATHTSDDRKSVMETIQSIDMEERFDPQTNIFNIIRSYRCNETEKMLSYETDDFKRLFSKFTEDYLPGASEAHEICADFINDCVWVEFYFLYKSKEYHLDFILEKDAHTHREVEVIKLYTMDDNRYNTDCFLVNPDEIKSFIEQLNTPDEPEPEPKPEQEPERALTLEERVARLEQLEGRVARMEQIVLGKK